MEALKAYTNLNSPAAFSSIDNVYKQIKNKGISRKQVLEKLQETRTYSLHKPRRNRFMRLKTVPNGFMTHIQADLADFQKIAKHNDGYRYLLVCVDVLSRRVFTAPVKSKTSKDMIEAFEIVFKKMPYLPHYLFTDKGIEFEAKDVKSFFKKKDILKYVAQSPDVKASIAERFIRTIKSRLYRYFTHYETLRWLEATEKIVQGINKTVNRSTGMRPNDINKKNADEVWNKLYLVKSQVKKPRYKEGDHVRISKEKGMFEKSYLPNYSKEVFTIDQVKPSTLSSQRASPRKINEIHGTVPNYRLVDSKGEEIVGKFYEQEFSKTSQGPNVFIIEKVLDQRRRAGKPEYLVKFKGIKGNVWIRR